MAGARRGPNWLLVYAVAYMVFLYAPVVLLPLFAFNDATIVAFPLSGFTTKWFTVLWETEALHGATAIGATANGSSVNGAVANGSTAGAGPSSTSCCRVNRAVPTRTMP